jgi:hypothetical protein
MSANGTFLGSASIVGSFTGTPSWSLTDALSVFQINSTTGVVTVANNTNLVNATHPTIPITISVSGTTPSVTPGNFTINVTIAGGPGLALGTYGSTTASGWTAIGPSDGTLPSAAFTNIIYVSDSMGSDLRDGSTPTFVDDNTTEQFVLSSNTSPVAGDTYTSPNGKAFTVAVSVTSQKLVQMTSRTGLPDASGTLTCSGSCTGPMTMAYTSAAPGIHGPVKTLTKGVGGTGPGLYDPNNTGSSSVFNGDGTGLGTIGNWHTAGAGNGFALRSGKPDWLLLRMGDTFTGQSLERGWSIAGGSDNFPLGGASELEPLVVGAYDEAVPATSPDLPSGARARPIIKSPSATAAYAAMQGTGNDHLYSARAGIQIQGAGNYIALMGLHFYSAQRDPGSGEYVGSGNVVDPTTAVSIPGQKIGILVEDVRAEWYSDGINIADFAQNYDITIRRSQTDHCYGNRALGINADLINPVGGSLTTPGGGPMSTGFQVDENVLDLCGYNDASLTVGNTTSRNAYLQWNAVRGSRRGNTSARSGSEDFQFRGGGTIDNNFTYAGTYGFDVGHFEGDPTLDSNTTATNNVIMSFYSTPNGTPPQGIQFYNSNDVVATNNLIANLDGSVSPFSWYAAADGFNGKVSTAIASNPGTGGTAGIYSCIGGTGTFTGGHSSTLSTFAITVASGSITDVILAEQLAGTSLVGDVLTPVSGYPSINTEGTTLTAAGTGGTPGYYGTTFASPYCPAVPANVNFGPVDGVALTNFSGSMAGAGARAAFALESFTGITRALNGGTGFYEATATGTTGFNDFTYGVHVGEKFTVTGATPSAYNGTWTAIAGTDTDHIKWSLLTGSDPGAETTPGGMTFYRIVSTGTNYVVNDVLTASPGGASGLQIRVDAVANLTGWQLTVATIDTNGVHNLSFTDNVIFNWPDGAVAPSPGDSGGTNDSPGGIPGSGAANIWTPNTFCTGAQFTGVITAPNNLATSGLINGPIAIGQNLAGPGVTANTTITGGSGTSWQVSPNQTASSTTMYSYTCSPTTIYPNPERTAETYAASLGLTATIDGYMTAALNNARWNWDPALTANNGINPYIRHGFGMTP